MELEYDPAEHSVHFESPAKTIPVASTIGQFKNTITISLNSPPRGIAFQGLAGKKSMPSDAMFGII